MKFKIYVKVNIDGDPIINSVSPIKRYYDSVFSHHAVTTNTPKAITIDETAEGDYCIVNSIYGTTIKPMVIFGKPKLGPKGLETNKITLKDMVEGDYSTLNKILRSTRKPVDGYGHLKHLLDDYMRKKHGQVMEGIWNFSNVTVNVVA